MMRHAAVVAVFAAIATLPVHTAQNIGHANVVNVASRAVGHAELGGPRAIRPLVSAVAADSERSLLHCCCCDSSIAVETAVVWCENNDAGKR